MVVLPAVVVFGTTVAIGLYMGLRYLRGIRNKPALVAVHLLLGVAGLEVLALLLRGAPDGQVAPSGMLGPFAALTMAGALLTGLLVPIIAKPRPEVIGLALAAHAAVGMAGFLALMLWLIGR